MIPYPHSASVASDWQVKDAIQTELVQAGESSSSRSRRGPRSSAAARGGSGAKYSRLDAEVAAMQRDSGTYCDEPTDAASYADWLKVSPAFTDCVSLDPLFISSLPQSFMMVAVGRNWQYGIA